MTCRCTREATHGGVSVRILPLLSLAAPGLMLVAAACSDVTDDRATPTGAASLPASATAATPRPATTTAATATSPRQAATAATTRPPTPPADGTVDPLGAGQQTPWPVKGSADPFPGVATVIALRAGVHPELGGWERIVFEFAGTGRPPALVQFVDKAVACGSGQAVVTQGTAVLEVAIASAQAHDGSGKATIPTTLGSPGGTVINGGVSSCDFEGHVTWDFGLNGKHNFKVSTLTNPPRIVIDIKQ